MDYKWTDEDLVTATAENKEQLSEWVMHETMKRCLDRKVHTKEMAVAVREEVRAEWNITVG
eukprot:828497-Pyramimonas_sp.AAC.2